MKKLLSFLLVLLLSTNMLTVSAADVITANSPISATIEVTDGLSVTYKASQAWAGKRNVEVKLANIGTTVIENWSLAFATTGKINNLWNAQILKQDGEKYIIKNSVYNKDIAVGGQITFGYTLTDGGDTVPEFIYATKRTELTDGVTVDFKVTSDWGTSFQGEIIIKNNTDETVNAWELSFNKNFYLYNIWTCKTLAGSKSDYDNITSVSGVYHNIDIASRATETLTLTGTKVNGKTPKISDVLVSACVFDESVLNEINDQTESEIPFVAVASFTPPDIITFAWTSAGENGSYSLLASDSENSGYTQIVQIGNVNEFDYKVSEAFETKHFKIEFTEGRRTFETEPITINRSNATYTPELKDTDEDNIPDYLEELLGLGKETDDTDNDGLTDFQELEIIYSNPLEYDSLVSGVSDAESDGDKDGLKTKDEITYLTDVSNPDSDGDGLTDGEEVKLGTNPLDIDSDDDTINDYDETIIGLDPTTASTNGTPDNQRQFTVNLTAEDEVLSEINTTNSPYEVSAEITAAGNVKANIEVRESRYADVVSSTATLGIIPEFNYTDKLNINNAVIRFKISGSVLMNSNLDRFVIFRYDESTNSLLPAETTYDYANSSLSVQTDELGTFTVVNLDVLESVWGKTLSQVDSVSNEEDIATVNEIQDTDNINQEYSQSSGVRFSQKSFSKSITKSNDLYSITSFNSNTTSNNSAFESVNIVFLLDARELFSSSDIKEIAQEASQTARKAFELSENANVYMATYGDAVNQYKILNSSNPYLDYTDIYYDILNNMGKTDNDSSIIVSDPFEFINSLSSDGKITYAYGLFNENELVFKFPSGKLLLDECKENNTYFNIISEITNHQKIGYIIEAQNETSGIHIDSYDDFSEKVISQIFGETETSDNRTYILSTNLQPVTLDSELGANYKSAFDTLSNTPELYLNYSSYADSDSDGLYDFQEIDFSDSRISSGAITINGNDVELISYADYCELNNKVVDRSIIRDYDDIYVIPVITNPVSTDTDVDAIPDRIDLYPTKYNHQDSFDETNYYISYDNQMFLTYNEVYGLGESAFEPKIYLEIDEQNFTFIKDGSNYLILANGAGNKPLTAVKTSSGYALRVAELNLNDDYLRWNIYDNLDGSYTIVNYGTRLFDNKFTYLSTGGLSTYSSSGLEITDELGIQPPKYDNDNKQITNTNFYLKDSTGHCVAEEYFISYVWNRYLYEYPFLSESDRMGCFTAWGESVYGYSTLAKANDVILVSEWVRKYARDRSIKEIYVALGLVDAGASIIDGVICFVKDPIGSVTGAVKLIYDAEQQELLQEMLYQVFYEYEASFTNDELVYNSTRILTKAVAEVVLDIVTAKISVAKVFKYIKGTKIVGKLVVHFKNVPAAVKLLNIASNVSTGKAALIAKMVDKINDPTDGLNKVYKVAKKLEFLNTDVADILNKIFDSDSINGPSRLIRSTDIMDLYGDEQVKFIAKYGDEYIDAVELYGRSYPNLFKKIDDAILNGRVDDLLTDTSFTDDFRKFTMSNGQPIDINQIDPMVKDMIKELRTKIGVPTAGTKMQKVIPQSYADSYLKNVDYIDRNYVEGFVSKVDDVSFLRTQSDVVNGLRLDYLDWETKYPAGGGYAIIEFDLLETGDALIPTQIDGIPNGISPTGMTSPYTGTGFTGNSSGGLIPEYYNSRVEFNTATIYVVDAYGNKIQFAIFKDGIWVAT
jgi:hypothetical protein